MPIQDVTSRSERARHHVHRSFERARVLAAVRALGLSAVVSTFAFALYGIRHSTGLLAGGFAISLAVLAWRGGPWYRGSIAGVIAGLPALLAPAVVRSLSVDACCTPAGLTAYAITCLVLGAPIGVLVAQRASTDVSPAPFAMAAMASGAMTGVLGCITLGLGGAVSIIVGVVAGSASRWLVVRYGDAER